MLKSKKYITALVPRTGGFEWCSVSIRGNRIETEGTGFLHIEMAEKQTKSGESVEVDQPVSAKPTSSESIPSFKGTITVGIPVENVFVRIFTFPPCDRGEIEGMVRLQMDKTSPFPLDEIEISHEILHNDEKGYIVFSAGVKRDFVEDITSRLESVGVIVNKIDVETLGWWRFIRDRRELDSHKQQIILVFDGQIVDLMVLENKVPILVRTIARYDGAKVESVCETVGAECARTLLWLELQGKVGGSVGLYVLYNGENKDALLEKIEASAGIKPVHLSLDVPCGLSVGLAYRAADNTELNLISRRWYQTLQERLKRRTIMNVAMVLFGLWVMLGGIFTGLWIWQKGVLARYEKTLLAYKTPAHEVLKLKRRMAILNRYMDRSGSALECLREVTSLMPQGVKLTSFTYKKGESMKISGEADRSELVLGFNEKLNSSKMFAHVTAETQTMTPEGKYRFGFNIKLAEEVNK
jgi:hypothetical protein